MTAATIRANTPVKIGVSGQADFVATFSGPIVRGHLTVAGKAITLRRSYPLAIGHLTVRGRANGNWISSAWQYLTVTTLTSIGQVYTLYDTLDPAAGLIPSINDVWRVPTFSTDGGAVTVSGDGRFEIGQPTSGIDTLVNVMYYNRFTDQWWGPTDVTILNPLLRLIVTPGHLLVSGKALVHNTTRIMGKGRLSIFGHQVQFNRQYPPMQAGHLTQLGKPMTMSRQMSIQPGHLTVSGKVLDLILRLTLLINPGHLTVAGKALLLGKALTLSIGHLTVAGKSLTLHVGLPLIMTPGHLLITGTSLRLTKALSLTPGRLTVHGRTMAMHTTGAVSVIDKPGIRRVGKRRSIVPSELR